jgi:hypothetical protein
MASRRKLPRSGRHNNILRFFKKSSCYCKNAPLWYQEFIQPRLRGQGADRTDARTVHYSSARPRSPSVLKT